MALAMPLVQMAICHICSYGDLSRTTFLSSSSRWGALHVITDVMATINAMALCTLPVIQQCIAVTKFCFT